MFFFLAWAGISADNGKIRRSAKVDDSFNSRYLFLPASDQLLVLHLGRCLVDLCKFSMTKGRAAPRTTGVRTNTTVPLQWSLICPSLNPDNIMFRMNTPTLTSAETLKPLPGFRARVEEGSIEGSLSRRAVCSMRQPASSSQ